MHNQHNLHICATVDIMQLMPRLHNQHNPALLISCQIIIKIIKIMMESQYLPNIDQEPGKQRKVWHAGQGKTSKQTKYGEIVLGGLLIPPVVAFASVAGHCWKACPGTNKKDNSKGEFLAKSVSLNLDYTQYSRHKTLVYAPLIFRPQVHLTLLLLFPSFFLHALLFTQGSGFSVTTKIM